MDVHKVRFYKQTIESRAKFHVTLGHETCMGTVLLFGRPLPADQPGAATTSSSSALSLESVAPAKTGFEFDCDYEYLPAFIDEANPNPSDTAQTKKEEKGEAEGRTAAEQQQTAPTPTPAAAQQRYLQYALVQLERALVAPSGALLIGSRLDSDLHANACRLAFYGRLLEPITSASASAHLSSASGPKSGTGAGKQAAAPPPPASASASASSQQGDAALDAFLASGRLRVFKRKCKTGRVERIVDQYNAICVGLFKKHSKFDAFNGFRVALCFSESRPPAEQSAITSTSDSNNESSAAIVTETPRVERKLNGVIDGAFGQSGKFKAHASSEFFKDFSRLLNL